ncbi:MAG: hypothetical protein V4675_04365 [Verrucomicrobiota bacterium]
MQVQNQNGLSALVLTTTATAPATLEVSFRRVNPQPADLGLTIEASPGLAGPWQRIAWKSIIRLVRRRFDPGSPHRRSDPRYHHRHTAHRHPPPALPPAPGHHYPALRVE